MTITYGSSLEAMFSGKPFTDGGSKDAFIGFTIALGVFICIVEYLIYKYGPTPVMKYYAIPPVVAVLVYVFGGAALYQKYCSACN